MFSFTLSFCKEYVHFDLWLDHYVLDQEQVQSGSFKEVAFSYFSFQPCLMYNDENSLTWQAVAQFW